MDIDIYTFTGVIIPVAGIFYTIIQKPRLPAMLLIIPSLYFMFVGAVSNAGLAAIDGKWASANDGRYLLGAVITVLSSIMLVISCLASKSDKDVGKQ